MKFVIRVILIAVLGYYLPFYLPWWSIMLIAFAVGYILPGNTFNVFNAGFLAGGSVWLGLSFRIDSATGNILSEKIVQLFPFEDATLLLIASGLVGAVAGGFAAATGCSFRNIFMKKAQKSVYS